MIVPQRIKAKIKAGQVLNLSELAYASGYDRGVLSKMNLPLQAKKLSLQDFHRIMRKRQDWQERKIRLLAKGEKKDGPSAIADNDQKREAADTFYGRSSKSGGKSASRQAQPALLRNIA